MSDVAGFNLLYSAIDDFKRDRTISTLGSALSPMGQNQKEGIGGPDQVSPASSAGMLDRAKQYIPGIQAGATHWGVPTNILLGVAATESGFNPNPNPHGNARGMFQFISTTGKQYGLDEQTVLDPSKSADAAAHYLRVLHDKAPANMSDSQKWAWAVRYYNGVGPGSDPGYVNKVMGYATGPFAGYGGSGGAPSSAGVAATSPTGGGGAATPSPSPTDASGGPQASTTTDAIPFEAVSSVAPAAAQQAAETDPIQQLGQQLNAARVAQGMKPLTQTQAIAEVQRLGPERVRALIGGAGANPEAGATAAQWNKIKAIEAQRRAWQPAPGTPPGSPPTAAGVPSLPHPVEPPPQARGVLTGAEKQGTLAPIGQPSVTGRTPTGPGGAPSMPPAPGTPEGQADLAKGHAADPADPPWPGTAGTNENGYFNHTSVYGQGFTLPQLIYNIKKANPGISDATLGRAILLAEPMLNAAAQDQARQLGLDVREASIAQRERASELSSATQLQKQSMADQTRLQVQSSVAAMQQRRLDEHASEYERNFDLKTRDAVRKDQALQATMERVKQGQERITLEQAKLLLQQRRNLNDERNKAMMNWIRTSSAQFMDDNERIQQEEIEKERYRRANEDIDALENNLGGAGQSATGAGKANGAAIPAERFFPAQ